MDFGQQFWTRKIFVLWDSQTCTSRCCWVCSYLLLRKKPFLLSRLRDEASSFSTAISASGILCRNWTWWAWAGCQWARWRTGASSPAEKQAWFSNRRTRRRRSCKKSRHSSLMKSAIKCVYTYFVLVWLPGVAGPTPKVNTPVQQR